IPGRGGASTRAQARTLSRVPRRPSEAAPGVHAGFGERGRSAPCRPGRRGAARESVAASRWLAAGELTAVRISELEAREDFSTILRTTLADGWSTTLGRPVEVSVRGRVSGQDWFVNPVFSAIHTRGVDPEVRHFLADSLKFTPKRARLPAQFLLGVGAATRAG